MFLSPALMITAAAFILAAVGGVCLAWAYPRVRPTTLVGPWGWACIALASVAGCEAAVGLAPGAGDADWLAPLRYSVATLTFCPLMALLGAKRPQHQAWQFVVASLWVVLALPAAEAFFLERAEDFVVRGVRAWFLAALIGVGLMNYLPTRFAPACILLAISQLLLVSRHLPLVFENFCTNGGMGGLAAGAAAIVAATLISWRPRPAATPLDRLWLDFRDSFGAFWALRFADRVNDAANKCNWPVTLRWSGFRDVRETGTRAPPSLPPPLAENIYTTLRGLLRRFVSPTWIASRLV